MLRSKNLLDKTFNEMMQEALTQIPLYSKEWTNFNLSDPGIHTIENLTAFNVMQQYSINQVTEEIQWKLLKLVGFEPKPGRNARVLLRADGLSEPLVLPDNQKFMVGDVCFETNRSMILNNSKLTGVFSVSGEEEILKNHSHILLDDYPVAAAVVGEKPEQGNIIYLVFDRLPEKGEDGIIYVTVADSHGRNVTEDRIRSDFARIHWQVFTEKGFVDLKFQDNTGGFLIDGELKFKMPYEEEAAVYSQRKEFSGYVIRGVLKKAEYDIVPKVKHMSGLLFEVYQKETKSLCYSFNKQTDIVLYCDLLEDEYINVYCKEEKGDGYHLYRRAYAEDEMTGRFYTMEKLGYGMYRFAFDRKKFGFGPARLKNAIKIVVYNEEMMQKYSLDYVYGYDDQVIELPVSHIVPETFSIIAEREDENGEIIYDFVKPGHEEDNALNYIVNENEGNIVIRDAGDYINSRLYLCTCAVSRGVDGNVRANNMFEPLGVDHQISFVNPGPGKGGCFKETLEETKLRFEKDINTSYTAVTAEDYQAIVMQTPDLCIQKVRAIMDRKRNMVNIVVRPNLDQEFCVLTPEYKSAIMKNLNKKRLLTTKVSLVSPVYVPINVLGTIYVKKHYENCEEKIKKVIYQFLDYIHSEHNFGDPVKFDELFHAIESLEYVAYVHDLSIRPQFANTAHMAGMDIAPVYNGLCFPGELSVQVNQLVK